MNPKLIGRDDLLVVRGRAIAEPHRNKKLLAIVPRLLLVALISLALPATLQAQFTFVTNNGAIKITKYTGSGGAVTIPSTTNGWPVVSIGTNAFNSSKVTGVTIPNSITNIERAAFFNCTNLANVTIPDSVTTIGVAAFDNCSALTEVIVGSGVTSIGTAAFYYCTSLSGITVDGQNSVYSSTNGVLFDKNQFVLIQYPPGKIGSYTIPNSVTNTGDHAFFYCTRLTSVTIPESVASIGDVAFEGCSALTSITIPSHCHPVQRHNVC